jgi:DNA-binding NtrC family response regulator
MACILVVDDELGIRALLSEILTDEGHTVDVAENAAQARAARERARPDLVLLDIWMPDVDGVTLLKEWGTTGMLTMPVIMMSGHGTIDTAVEATKSGAVAFLEKPITLQKLLSAVAQGLARPAPRISVSALVDSRNVTALAAADEAVDFDDEADESDRADDADGPRGTPPPSQSNGPQPEQSFDLNRPLRVARDAFEKSYFEFHLAQEGGSMTRVAEKTGLERTHLYRKLKQLGVDLSRGKRGGY